MRNQVLIGNALEELRKLPDGIAQVCCTSPPYWNLRDYSEHGVRWDDGWEGQLGQEPSSDLYIQHLISILEEVRRILRPDGTLWLNLGDTYVQKRLEAIPWRTAMGLRDKGWILRSEIIWNKTAGMPENVSDRPTSAFEPIFMLTKSERYFYDAEAIRTPSGANCRNVWSFPPTFYKGQHSAVFPPDLPRRCILVSSSDHGSCWTCGAPYERQLERTSKKTERAGHPTRYGDVGNQSFKGHGFPHIDPPTYRTLGWARTCGCEDQSVRGCLVLDPFAGSGTTLQEAYGLGRDYLGVEINPVTLPEIEKRLEDISGKAIVYQARREGFDL